jgi:hypothetical protein
MRALHLSYVRLYKHNFKSSIYYLLDVANLIDRKSIMRRKYIDIRILRIAKLISSID